MARPAPLSPWRRRTSITAAASTPVRPDAEAASTDTEPLPLRAPPSQSASPADRSDDTASPPARVSPPSSPSPPSRPAPGPTPPAPQPPATAAPEAADPEAAPDRFETLDESSEPLRPAAIASVVPPPQAQRPRAPPMRHAAPMQRQASAWRAAPLPPHQIGVGTVLRDRYELQALLGRGGMGSVYKALDRYRASLALPDRHVALKIAAALPDGAGSRALGREFQSAQQLSHPNVINVYEIDHEGEASFYTMELLEGARLSEVLQPIGPAWPLSHALTIVRDIGAAVAHAHSRGLVHGDLKPQNVFITHSGQVRVLDFGGVAAADPRLRDPLAAPALGAMAARRLDDPYDLGPFLAATPAYASCEQLEGQPADPRDDLYALACIAYQLFTGRHPYDGRSSLQARALRLRPARPRALRAVAWRALRQGLSFDRAQRTLEIDAWLRDLGVAQAIEHLPPHWQRASMAADRPVGRQAATAAALLIGLGLAAWLLQQQGLFDLTGLVDSARSTVLDAWQQIQARSSNALGVNPPAAAAPIGSPSGPTTLSAPPAPSGPQGASRGRAPGNDHRAAEATAAITADAASRAPERAAAVTFSAARYAVSGSAPAARIVVRRVGNTRGEVPFVWWTEAASAKPDVDYAPLGHRVELIPRGKHDVTIFVPIISNPLRQQPTQFHVALRELHASGQVAPSARVTVTIAPSG